MKEFMLMYLQGVQALFQPGEINSQKIVLELLQQPLQQPWARYPMRQVRRLIRWWHAMGGVNGERVIKSPMTLTPPSQITMWFLSIRHTLKQ